MKLGHIPNFAAFKTAWMIGLLCNNCKWMCYSLNGKQKDNKNDI